MLFFCIRVQYICIGSRAKSMMVTLQHWLICMLFINTSARMTSVRAAVLPAGAIGIGIGKTLNTACGVTVWRNRVQ